MYDDKTTTAQLGSAFYNYRSYGINIYMADGDSKTQDKLVNVQKPSSTALVADNFNYTTLYPQSDSVGPRHNAKCNVLFADGHVAPITVTPAILNYNFKDPFWGKNF